MEIKAITLDGFLSYYEEKRIPFSDGTTIILGKNNTGKSKLFDAFHFVLFNRVFDSQMEVWIDDPKAVAKAVLNNKKKNDAISTKGKTRAAVCLELEAEDYPESIIYIDREISYDYSNGDEPITDHSFSITIQDSVTGNAKPYVGTAAEVIVYQLFPSCLRDFILFQGEAASELMKLSKKNQSTIEKAIRQVSRLDLFEKATEISESYYKSKVGTLTRQSSANQKVMAKIEELRSEIANYEKKKESSKAREIQSNEKIDSLTDTIQKQKEELEQHEVFLKLFAEKEDLKKKQQEAVNALNRFKEINQDISDTWVFYKVLDKVQSFSDFYKSLEIIGQVPAPISQSEIKKSLKLHCCSSCGSSLDEGTPLFANVKNKVQNDAIDGLGKMMSGLNFAFSNKAEEIEKVPNSIQEYIKQRTKNEDSRKYYQQQLDEINNKIKSAEVSSEDKEKKRSIDILRALYMQNESELKRWQANLTKATQGIEFYQNEINERNSKIVSQLQQTGEVDELDKVKVYYSKKLYECMVKLCSAAQDLAYNEIQTSSNELYHDMMKENSAIVGDIRIDRQNSEIYTVNSLGDKITNLNTGSRITIQLAVISGILSVAASQFSSFYPFITDAPTSKLDSINKMQVIKCMIRAFEQSIIIVKDDVNADSEDDPLRELIMNSNDIGTAYELNLEIEPGSSNIDDQYTVVHTIKEE